jgi:hypothetical protein
MSRPTTEYVGAHEDRHRVADRVRKSLQEPRDPRAAYLLPRSDWLLHVWYTNRDFEYPSPDGYDTDEGPDGNKKHRPLVNAGEHAHGVGRPRS